MSRDMKFALIGLALAIGFFVYLGVAPSPASAARDPYYPIDQPAITPELKPAVAGILRSEWSRVMQACPGFRKYGRSVTSEGAANGWYGEPNAVWFGLDAKDPPVDERLSRLFIAGNHCAFGIVDKQGVRLETTKHDCLSLCTDHLEQNDSNAHYEVTLF